MPETQTAGDILTIRQLAEYLMVSEKTVYRMLDRNELPAVRVGAQWRFRKQDIDAWLTEEVRRVEYEGQRGALDPLETSEIAITPLLAPENVWLAVTPGSRDELLADIAASGLKVVGRMDVRPKHPRAADTADGIPDVNRRSKARIEQISLKIQLAIGNANDVCRDVGR